MSTSINTLSSQNLKVSHAAYLLNSTDRQKIGIQAIKGKDPVSHVANSYNVSRKFIYQQKEKAIEGIVKAFEPSSETDEDVLFNIPVTKSWISQMVLSLIFIGRASYQRVEEFFRDLFDYKIAKSTVHNIVYTYLEKAKTINGQQDLSNVKEGLHDEIYQAGEPVLVGCCARSTYCYLLKNEEICDANSWGVHLLDLKEKQGLIPNFTVIDGGQSARKGQKDAWPEIPAHGDVFHALKPMLDLVSYLENRAMDTLKVVEELKRKIKKPRGKLKNKQQELMQSLIEAEEKSQQAIALVDDITILFRWTQKDILSLVGPSYKTRKELLKFVVDELRLREAKCPHKIELVRKYLENHSDNLLEFVVIMEVCFYNVAEEFKIPLSDVLSVYQLKDLSRSSNLYWEKHTALRAHLGERFHLVDSAIEKILNETVRANSLVENLNSRLRTYFTLRREIGNEYLEFLQFFLNHRRFMRSERSERVGKSPAELLTGENHEHWLEMLGFTLFKRAA